MPEASLSAVSNFGRSEKRMRLLPPPTTFFSHCMTHSASVLPDSMLTFDGENMSMKAHPWLLSMRSRIRR